MLLRLLRPITPRQPFGKPESGLMIRRHIRQKKFKQFNRIFELSVRQSSLPEMEDGPSLLCGNALWG